MVGNNDDSILYYGNFYIVHQNTNAPNYWSFISGCSITTFNTFSQTSYNFDSCVYCFPPPPPLFRAVLSGKGTNAVFLKVDGMLDVRKFYGHSNPQSYQILAFRNQVFNG